MVLGLVGFGWHVKEPDIRPMAGFEPTPVGPDSGRIDKIAAVRPSWRADQLRSIAIDACQL